MTSPNYTLFRFWSTLCIHSIRSTERTHFPKVKEQSAQSSDFLYLAQGYREEGGIIQSLFFHLCHKNSRLAFLIEQIL